MSDQSSSTLKWIMRAGYGARGVIYLIVGALAFMAVFSAGEAQGSKDALASLRGAPFGRAALWLIALGMFAYMVWRVVAGVADVEDHGSDAKGLFARGAQITTGLLHGAIGVSIATLAMGSGGGQGGGASDWTQKLMQMPGGRWLVALAALIMAGAGAYYAYKGLTGKYRDHLEGNKITRDFQPALTFGLVVYGIMLALVGLSLAYAAINADPSQAGGLGQALNSLQSKSFGQWLLGGAGLGLIGFSLYNFVEAKYRIIPRLSKGDIPTLADA